MIVHIITGLSRGGAESALFRLLSQERDPARVRVVSLTDEGVFGARLLSLGIRVTCLRLQPRRPSPKKLLRLVCLLRRWRPRLVQTWMYHADLVGGLAARIVGIPVCWGVRQSNVSPGLNKAERRLVIYICALVSRWVPSRIISCSQKAIDVHRTLGYAAPFELVPNGLDVSAWCPRPELRLASRTKLNIPKGAFLFAHAGRADSQKDHPSLARAFSRVHAEYPHVWLMLCGDGLMRGDPYFEALPFTVEAKQQLLVLGPRDDLPDLWQGADAFVLSSLGEAFPNVVAEAMACSLPCIVTDVGDAAEIVGDTGFIVPPNNVCSLAQSMVDMLHMSMLDREKLGRMGRQRIQTRFNLEKMTNGFDRVWREVLKESEPRCAD